jgi:hypothetical protein
MTLKACVLLAPVVLLCNCVSVGTKDLDDAAKYVELEKGASTKRDVHRLFGQPADVTYKGAAPSSPSTWTYFKADMHTNGWAYVPFVGIAAGGSNEENYMAVLDFDAKGIFRSIQTEKDTSYTNTWMALTRDIYRINHDPKAGRVKEEMTRLGQPFDARFAKNMGERRWNH